MSLSIFGVRHHGPGCARSLRAALETLEPDIVLIEGPPDAQDVLALLGAQEMRPPVALLIYAPDAPHCAVYYPFTHFSPEWQALSYALTRGIPARFIDLPQSIQLAQVQARQKKREEDTSTGSASDAALEAELEDKAEERDGLRLPTDEQTRVEPLDLLAKSAGYDDYELWWERQIEQRRDVTNLFEGILEAMTAMRETREDAASKNECEAQREAHMRQRIRAAQKAGFSRIAVVCGAWHAPALSKPGGEQTDAELLDGLERIQVASTWIPWTNSRLSFRSGYGAGVTSPGWYEHLWTAPDRATIRWVAQAAHLLRAEGLDASSASVIEAVRLAEALASIRGLSMPGLGDLHEAIQTVLCNGNAEPMQLIRDKLEIGEQLGEAPEGAPAVPLQRDLEIRQRKLRFKPSPSSEMFDFDLRKETDRARSQLLHQLLLLNIEWGRPHRTSQKHSTFHELWTVQWQVEFAIKLIEANIWGNTVESAATAFVCHLAQQAEGLPRLTELLDRAILAELPAAIETLLSSVQSKAAVSTDMRHLMDALPPLARVARYGNVRQTSVARVLPVFDALFERIVIGLPGACASLDDDAALAMVGSIDNVQSSVSLLNRDNQREEWQGVLRYLVNRDGVHGLVRGRCCRLLLEQKVFSEEDMQRLAGLALSPANPTPQAAAWIEGVLHGSGLLLLHQAALWLALDRWLSELPADAFAGLLPLLRRAFSGFEPPERRAMGEKVKHLRQLSMTGKSASAEGDKASEKINEERAKRVLPVLAHVLGVHYDAY